MHARVNYLCTDLPGNCFQQMTIKTQRLHFPCVWDVRIMICTRSCYKSRKAYFFFVPTVYQLTKVCHILSSPFLLSQRQPFCCVKMFPFAANSSFDAHAMMFRNSVIRAQHDPTTMGMGNMNIIGSNSQPKHHEAVNDTIVIRPNDVLCGRGKISFNHSGNRRFRHVISQSIDEYKAAGSKWEKSLVAAKLVSEIHSTGGRFLKQKKNNEDEWYELSSSECKSKVSHAIRDAIAATRQSRRPSLEEEPSSSASASASSSITAFKKLNTRPATTVTDEPKPLFRGTWSSNSLVSLTDDSDKAPERTSSSSTITTKSTKPMNDESSSSASDNIDESSSSSDGDDFEDDFLSFINEAVGPTLVKNKAWRSSFYLKMNILSNFFCWAFLGHWTVAVQP